MPAGIGGLFQGLAQGFSQGAEIGMGMRRMDMQEEAQKQLAKTKDFEQGKQQVDTLGDVLKMPLANRKLMTKVAVDNKMLRPEVGDAISKLSDEQAIEVKDAIFAMAAEDPDFGAQKFGQLMQQLPVDKMMLELFKKGQEIKDKRIAQALQSAAGGQPTDTAGMPSASSPDAGGPPVPAVQPPQITPEQGLLRINGEIKSLEAAHASLRAYEDRVLKAPGLSESKRKDMLASNRTRIDDLSARLAQVYGQKKDAMDQARHDQDQKRLDDRETRLTNQPGQDIRDELRAMGVDPQNAQAPQIQAALKSIQQRKLDVATSTASATAQARNENAPVDPTTQKDLTSLGGAMTQIGTIRSNLSKEFLGPVRGSDAAFSARRSLGTYIGSPVGEKEVVFRQTLADLTDQLLRARSGAAITESEYQRLKNMMPKATDELPVFEAGLKRFETTTDNMLKAKQKMATTKRKDVGKGSSGGGIQGMSNEELLKALNQ